MATQKQMTETARRLCESAPETGATIRVVWKKSRTWGLCPTAMNYRQEPMAKASGCGYDKASTVLADTLCWLPGVDKDEISRMGGCGVSSLARRLEEFGWRLECVYEGVMEDGYRIVKL